jgi:hypothetical protein
MKVREMASALGSRGGRARARRLSAKARKRIAALGGKARARSLRAAQRVADNFRYAAAVLELQGRSPEVKRVKTFQGPLPGIYPAKS